MLTITGEITHENVTIAEDEIILNGPPTALEGHVSLHSNHKEPLRLKHLALRGMHGYKGGRKAEPSIGSLPLRFNCRLEPGEQKIEHISHALAYNTPPGVYEDYLMLSGRKRKVKMIVQPTIEISLTPTSFTFQNTAPGTVHTAMLTLTNMGNLPFQIPEIKHVGALDMDLLCRAFGFGFRKNGKEGLTQTLDEVTRNIKENLIDWAAVSVKEYGKEVQPGKSMALHLQLTMPDNSNAKHDYNGTIRFWDEDLTFTIKSHIEQPNVKRHGK